MRSTARLLLVLALVVSLLPGCSLSELFKRKRRPKAPGEMAMPQIGTITLVNPENSFVLIDSGYRMSPVVGEIVESRAPDGTISQLRVTDLRKRPFVIADIVSGIPGKGDIVFQKKKEVKVPVTPAPPSQ